MRQFQKTAKKIVYGIKLLCLLLCGLLAGCGDAILNPKGIVAVEQKQLLVVTVLLMLIVVIPVFVMTLYFSYKYKASHKKEIYEPDWANNVLLEIIWWGVPIIIIIVLAIITWFSTYRLNPYKPLVENNPNSLIIDVVALNWKWLFIYPKQNIASVNYLQFPVNTSIQFNITSDAPMNSFIMPQLAGQIYAMSGMKTQLHLIANQEGIYAGFSANYSGIGFAFMNFHAHVTSKQAFDEWVQLVKQTQNPLTLSVYEKLSAPSTQQAAIYYSTVAPQLFQHVMNKYTLPGHQPMK